MTDGRPTVLSGIPLVMHFEGPPAWRRPMTPDFLIERGAHLFRGPAGQDKRAPMVLAMTECMDGERKALILDYKAVWDEAPPGMAVMQSPDPDLLPEMVRLLHEGSLLAIDGPQFFRFEKPHYELPVGAHARIMAAVLKEAERRGIRVFVTWTDGLEERT